jgi:hypothetical protein
MGRGPYGGSWRAKSKIHGMTTFADSLGKLGAGSEGRRLPPEELKAAAERMGYQVAATQRPDSDRARAGRQAAFKVGIAKKDAIRRGPKPKSR